MMGDEAIPDRQWDVERCPGLGCDYFHEKRHSVQVQAKKHKEMDANIQALGWFWGRSGK
jgi:hypothetical protein